MQARVKFFVRMLPIFLVGLVAFIAIGGVIVRGLWNWLLPPLFGWHVITFWQALGLLLLSRILFGGLSTGGRAMRRRPPIVERWKHMSEEERERFRRGFWGRMGFTPTGGETPGC